MGTMKTDLFYYLDFSGIPNYDYKKGKINFFRTKISNGTTVCI